MIDIGLITAIVICITILTIIIVILYFYFKLKKIFRTHGINRTFLNQIKNSIKNELDDDNTIKDVFGLESVQLESFKKEFPLINILEFKDIVNNNIINYFNSINSGEILIKECTDSVKANINNLISNNVNRANIYSDVKIHKTIMEKYLKRDNVVVSFQTSLEYMYLVNDKKVKRQERFKSTYVFSNSIDENKQLNCPNCGASIRVGNKNCKYCHTKVSNDGIIYFVLSEIKSI